MGISSWSSDVCASDLSGVNEMLATGDPTAHAELGALRATSRALGSPDLSGCAVFASGHPCPMCMAAMRLSGIGAVTYAYSNEDGAPYGLSTAAIYADLAKPFAEQAMHIRHVPQGEPELYADWARKQQAKRSEEHTSELQSLMRISYA